MLIDKYKRKIKKKFHKLTKNKYKAPEEFANNNFLEKEALDRELLSDLKKLLSDSSSNIDYTDSKSLILNVIKNNNTSEIYKILRYFDDSEKVNKYDLYLNYYMARSLLSYAAWDMYNMQCMENYNQLSPDSKIEGKGLLHGSINKELIQKLIEEYKNCETKPFTADDCSEHFMFNPFIFGKSKDVWNKFAVFKNSTPKLIGLLEEFLASVKTQFEQDMGHYFTIVGIRTFELCPLRTEFGPHMWHKDSHPSCTKKLMIYLTDASPETGSTQYELYDGTTHEVQGAAGNWVLFSNSLVRHRGLPPELNNRPIIELTVAPALKTDIKVNDTGLNAIFPWFPLPDKKVKDIPEKQNAFIRNYKRAMQLALNNGSVLNSAKNIDNMIGR